MLQADFYMPTRLFFGEGALDKGKDVLLHTGKHAMIVTGKSSAKKCGALDEVTALLESAKITYTVFDKVPTSAKRFLTRGVL